MNSTTPRNKIHAALAIDRFWAIDARYAESRLQAMEAMAEHVIASKTPTPGSENWSATKSGDCVIRIDGVMTKEYNSFEDGCSTVRTRRALRNAANDPECSRIILVIDSPGGSVFGTADLADDVRKAAEMKPVIAYIEDMCCSAAIWVASQCTEVVASPNALAIGSIGVYTVLYDTSEAFEAMGVKPILISSGGIKGQPTNGLPIDEEVLADDQNFILQIYDAFVSTVASGRGMETADVLSIADGRTWGAAEAKELGLVDRLASWDDLFEEPEATVATAVRATEAKETMSFNPFKLKRPAANPATENPVTPPEGAAEAQINQDLIANAVKAVVKSKVDAFMDAGKVTANSRGPLEKVLTLAIQADEIETRPNGELVFGATYDAQIAFIDSLEASKLTTPVINSTNDATGERSVVVETSGKAEESSYAKSYKARKGNK